MIGGPFQTSAPSGLIAQDSAITVNNPDSNSIMPYVYWRCGPFAISLSKLGLLVCWNDHTLGVRSGTFGRG